MKVLITLLGLMLAACTAPLVPAGTVFVPLSTGPTPHLQFNTADQQVFVESFRAELQRLKLVREALPASAGGAGGKRSFLKQYRVVSNEGDSWLQRMNTNAQEGKAKAGKKLMQQLIPDVAAYIAENRKPTGQTL